MRSRLAAALIICAVLAGCSATHTGVTATRSRQIDNTPLIPPDSTPPSTPETTPGNTPGTTPASEPPGPSTTLPVEPGIVDFGERGPAHPEYDGYLVAVFKDIEAFWAEQFPEVYGQPFEPLSGGIFAAYPGREAPIPGCGEPQTGYRDVEGNAFYCSIGDFMAYDDDQLIPDLVQSLGESAVGVVLAHEFGHAVQARAGNMRQPTILKEQQADCFAGAWAAHLARGESPGLTFSDNDVKGGLIAMINVRDPIEVSGQFDPGAHGTGFDRAGAFQDGFEGGPQRCKTFFTENRDANLVQIPFSPDDPNAGNLPFPEIITGTDTAYSIVDELTRYWTTLFAGSTTPFTAPTVVTYPGDGPYPSCDGIPDSAFKDNVLYCAATNEVLLDEDYGKRLDANPLTGDMSVGYLLSDGFSEAVLTTLGSRLTGAQRALSDDCLTGSWVRVMFPDATDRPQDDKNLVLSAGDLDEAIITAISRGDQSADADINGTPFDKVKAFRTGVLQGRDGCGV